jgi:hypothetical protein
MSKVIGVCDNFGAGIADEGVANSARRCEAGDARASVFSFNDFSLACRSDNLVTVPNLDLISCGVNLEAELWAARPLRSLAALLFSSARSLLLMPAALLTGDTGPSFSKGTFLAGDEDWAFFWGDRTPSLWKVTTLESSA